MKRIFTLLTALLLSATAATAAETGSTENLARAAVPLEGEGVQDWFQVPGRPIVQGSDALNDGRPETAVAFPAGRNASVGLEWVRELFVGRLVVRFAGAVPPRPTTVDFYNGGKWLTLDKNLEFTEAREGGALGWAVTFEPRVMEKIRLRWDVLAAGIRVAEIEAYESETLAPLEFLAKHPGRNVDEEIMALPGDPSYHDLAIRALSRPASTYVGEGMLCAWNGMMEKPGSLAVTVGKERRMLGYGPLKGNTLARRPLKGYLPVVEVVAYEDGLCYWQASLSPQPFEVLAAVRVTNTRKEPVAAEFAVSWWYQDERGKLLPTPGISAVDGGNGIQSDGSTKAYGNGVLLVCDRPGDFESAARQSLVYRPSLKPGETFELHVRYSSRGGLKAPHTRQAHETALREVATAWDTRIGKSMKFQVPDERITAAARNYLGHFAGRKHMEYAMYGGQFYGYEEGEAILGLAYWGQLKSAQECLDNSFARHVAKLDSLDNAWVRKHNWPGFLGNISSYSMEVFSLSRDEAWLKAGLPVMRKCADWIQKKREEHKRTIGKNSPRPPHWGWFSEWGRFGDPGMAWTNDGKGGAHDLVLNACCWRGLRDTGLALRSLGQEREALPYLEAAEEFRDAYVRAAATNLREFNNLPYLPMSASPFTVGEKNNFSHGPCDLRDYYQLLAPTVLATEILDFRSPAAKALVDFCERDRRIFLGVTRYEHGMDPHYSFGFAESWLARDNVERLILGLYAWRAIGMDRYGFTCPEVGRIYTSNKLRDEDEARGGAREPMDFGSTGPGVYLRWLRMLLLHEERDAQGMPSGTLLITPATPRDWLQDGKTIALENAPTFFGPASFSIRSEVSRGNIQAAIETPTRNPPKKIVLRLRHPAGAKMTAVTVNGENWKDFDPEHERVSIPAKGGSVKVIAHYGK